MFLQSFASTQRPPYASLQSLLPLTQQTWPEGQRRPSLSSMYSLHRIPQCPPAASIHPSPTRPPQIHPQRAFICAPEDRGKNARKSPLSSCPALTTILYLFVSSQEKAPTQVSVRPKLPDVNWRGGTLNVKTTVHSRPVSHGANSAVLPLIPRRLPCVQRLTRTPELNVVMLCTGIEWTTRNRFSTIDIGKSRNPFLPNMIVMKRSPEMSVG